MTLQLFLYLLGLVLLVVAAFGVSLPRVHLGWLGLALWLFAAAILPAID
jgi:hypothetical protein